MNERQARRWVEANMKDQLFGRNYQPISEEEERVLVKKVMRASALEADDEGYYEPMGFGFYLREVERLDEQERLKKQQEDAEAQRRKAENEKAEKERPARIYQNDVRVVTNVIELYKENELSYHHMTTDTLDSIIRIADFHQPEDFQLNLVSLKVLSVIARAIKLGNTITREKKGENITINTFDESFNKAVVWLTHQKEVKNIFLGFVDAVSFQVSPKINAIRLINQVITEKHIKELGDIPSGQLTEFYAENCQFETVEMKAAFLTALFKHQHLTRISFIQCGLTSKYLQVIENYLDTHVQLDAVDVSSNLFEKSASRNIENLLARNKLIRTWPAALKTIETEKMLVKRGEMLRELNWRFQLYKDNFSENTKPNDLILECFNRHAAMVEAVIPSLFERIELNDEKQFITALGRARELLHALVPSDKNQCEILQKLVDRVFVSCNVPKAILDYVIRFAQIKKLTYLQKPSPPPLAQIIANNPTVNGRNSPVFRGEQVVGGPSSLLHNDLGMTTTDLGK